MIYSYYEKLDEMAFVKSHRKRLKGPSNELLKLQRQLSRVSIITTKSTKSNKYPYDMNSLGIGAPKLIKRRHSMKELEIIGSLKYIKNQEKNGKERKENFNQFKNQKFTYHSQLSKM